MKLVLFDIDGTILLTDGAGKRAVHRALKIRVGKDDVGVLATELEGGALEVARSRRQDLATRDRASRKSDLIDFGT